MLLSTCPKKSFLSNGRFHTCSLPSWYLVIWCAAKDSTVAEYDVDKPSQVRGLRLTSLHHLAGPTALSPGPSPTSLAFAPPLPYFTQGCSDTLLLVADEAYKLRLYNADTHLCVSTAVGPLHSGPINSCRVFRSDAVCMASSTVHSAQHLCGHHTCVLLTSALLPNTQKCSSSCRLSTAAYL